jgi:hypothetical protein
MTLFCALCYVRTGQMVEALPDWPGFPLCQGCRDEAEQMTALGASRRVASADAVRPHGTVLH